MLFLQNEAILCDNIPVNMSNNIEIPREGLVDLFFVTAENYFLERGVTRVIFDAYCEAAYGRSSDSMSNLEANEDTVTADVLAVYYANGDREALARQLEESKGEFPVSTFSSDGTSFEDFRVIGFAVRKCLNQKGFIHELYEGDVRPIIVDFLNKGMEKFYGVNGSFRVDIDKV